MLVAFATGIIYSAVDLIRMRSAQISEDLLGRGDCTLGFVEGGGCSQSIASIAHTERQRQRTSMKSVVQVDVLTYGDEEIAPTLETWLN